MMDGFHLLLTLVVGPNEVAFTPLGDKGTV
jgi:hypothetical protein